MMMDKDERGTERQILYRVWSEGRYAHTLIYKYTHMGVYV
jgi:hypothetical protein